MREFKSIVPFPLYQYRIYIIFTDSLSGSADNLGKQGKLKIPHGIDDTTDGFHVRMPNQSYSFIVLKHKANINHIVHESYHAISAMFDWISARHEEELFAYHLAYLVQVVKHDQEKTLKKLEKELDKHKQV